MCPLIKGSGNQLGFIVNQLIPSSAQTLPPCRIYETTNYSPDSISETSATMDIPREIQKEVCMAEGIFHLSSPRNQLRPIGIGDSYPLLGEYHYAGPKTSTQNNRGVWGRNYVVDPNVIHDNNPTQFVAERVYADNGTSWIEAGWSEDSWKDEGQLIYVMETISHTNLYYPEYPIVSGSAVETEVYYNSDVGKWRALYYLGNNEWRILREVSLGFIEAENSYNQGEVYTANGIHPILPLSNFNTGMLLIDDVWRYWDTRYATDVWEYPPYECDMLTQYYLFNIYIPMKYTYIPIFVKE